MISLYSILIYSRLSSLFNDQFIQDSGLFRAQFIQYSGLFKAQFFI
jgi:hypothetical protein